MPLPYDGSSAEREARNADDLPGYLDEIRSWDESIRNSRGLALFVGGLIFWLVSLDSDPANCPHA
jgi:hypothetical protein